MRLSEAIRLGAKLRPQAFGAWFPLDRLYGFKSCALGAALEAAGFDALGICVAPQAKAYSIPSQVAPHRHLVAYWAFTQRKVLCPAKQDCLLNMKPGAGAELSTLVIHLNDSHMWSRENIADWLEASGLDPEAIAPEKEAKAEKQVEKEELVCV